LTTKIEVRARLLEIRASHSEAERALWSNAITEAVLASSLFSSASVIQCYLSNQTEVETDGIIQAALDLKKQVVVPVITKNNLVLSEIDDLVPTHFRAGPLGIREPIDQRKECKKTVDLFILPGVAYDRMGNRLGQGGGYYDRLLAPLMGILRMGLAFESQIIDRVPVTPTDCRVDQIITEARVIVCERGESCLHNSED
jgi:5-formyltetrahydrofolate cyclo-ligase